MAKNLSNIREIGNTLTLDSSSALEDLSGILRIGGSVMVNAKTKKEADDFLKKIKLPKDSVEGNVIFVMKHYT